MTIDQPNKLTDEEVRVRVAERMGCKWLKSGKYRIPTFDPVIAPECYSAQEFANGSEPIGNLDCNVANIPDYPADLNAAFTLVEKLRGEGWSCRFFGPNNHANWFVDVTKRTTIHRAEHPSLARAISLAFLAVTEREEG